MIVAFRLSEMLQAVSHYWLALLTNANEPVMAFCQGKNGICAWIGASLKQVYENACTVAVKAVPMTNRAITTVTMSGLACIVITCGEFRARVGLVTL